MLRQVIEKTEFVYDRQSAPQIDYLLAEGLYTRVVSKGLEATKYVLWYRFDKPVPELVNTYLERYYKDSWFGSKYPFTTLDVVFPSTNLPNYIEELGYDVCPNLVEQLKEGEGVTTHIIRNKETFATHIFHRNILYKVTNHGLETDYEIIKRIKEYNGEI